MSGYLKLTREEITDIFQTAQVFNIDVVDEECRQRDLREQAHRAPQ